MEECVEVEEGSVADVLAQGFTLATTAATTTGSTSLAVVAFAAAAGFRTKLSSEKVGRGADSSSDELMLLVIIPEELGPLPLFFTFVAKPTAAVLVVLEVLTMAVAETETEEPLTGADKMHAGAGEGEGGDKTERPFFSIVDRAGFVADASAGF